MRRAPPQGSYQLQVHIVEGRELAGRDSNGVSDAMVVVSAFGQQRRTETKYKQTSPLWDEQIFLSSDDLDEEALNKSQIAISVYDVDLVTRDLVGHFIINASSIYYMADHELWRSWVTLSAPHHERARFLSQDAEGGVQGYLHLSITLLGPGDKPKVHSDDEEFRAAGASPVLLPPTMRRSLVFLRIGVLCARRLPRMDSTGTAGIDAYVKIRFNGYVCKTPVITSQNPEWMMSFFLPMLVPSIGGVAMVEVRDRDQGFKDEYVGEIAIHFDEAMARHSRGKGQTLGWHHLYAMGAQARETGGGQHLSLLQGYRFMKAGLTGRSHERELLLRHQVPRQLAWRCLRLLSASAAAPHYLRLLSASAFASSPPLSGLSSTRSHRSRVELASSSRPDPSASISRRSRARAGLLHLRVARQAAALGGHRQAEGAVGAAREGSAAADKPRRRHAGAARAPLRAARGGHVRLGAERPRRARRGLPRGHRRAPPLHHTLRHLRRRLCFLPGARPRSGPPAPRSLLLCQRQ